MQRDGHAPAAGGGASPATLRARRSGPTNACGSLRHRSPQSACHPAARVVQLRSTTAPSRWRRPSCPSTAWTTSVAGRAPARAARRSRRCRRTFGPHREDQGFRRRHARRLRSARTWTGAVNSRATRARPSAAKRAASAGWSSSHPIRSGQRAHIGFRQRAAHARPRATLECRRRERRHRPAPWPETDDTKRLGPATARPRQRRANTRLTTAARSANRQSHTVTEAAAAARASSARSLRALRRRRKAHRRHGASPRQEVKALLHQSAHREQDSGRLGRGRRRQRREIRHHRDAPASNPVKTACCSLHVMNRR